MIPKLYLLPLWAFIKYAWQDGARHVCTMYTKTDGPNGPYEDKVYAWSFAAHFPFHGARALAHEYGHHLYPHREHLPWYTFDVFSYNPIRLGDRYDLMARSESWRKEVM